MAKLACLIVALGLCLNLASSESDIAMMNAVDSPTGQPAVRALSDWPAPPRRHSIATLGEPRSPCRSCAQLSKAYGIVHHKVGQPPAWGRANDQAKGCWIAMDCNLSGVEFTSAHRTPHFAPGLDGFFGNPKPTQSAPPSSTERLENGQISELQAFHKPVDAPITADTMNGLVDWEKIAANALFSTVQVRIVGQSWDWMKPQQTPPTAQWSGTAWFIAHSEIGDGTVVTDHDELLLVTNAHVAADAVYATIMVPTAGSHPIEVDVVGTCVARDLALLRVKNPADLRTQVTWSPAMLSLGDSDKMKRAGQVMVLGYPLGLSGVKASMGFVSGYQQFEEELYLQVTAPIDGGNSGGPLLDEEGQVIGVVSAKIAQASGMSFAIPSVELKALLHVLYTRRSVHLPLIGFDTPTVSTRHQREYFGIKDSSAGCINNQSGLLIDSVAPASLFSAAGLQAGDVLLSLDDVSVDRYSQVWVEVLEDRVHLNTFLARKPFLEKLKIDVWRGDRLVNLEVTYDSTPLLAVPNILETVNMRPYSASFAGVSMMNLTENVLKAMFNYRLAKFIEPAERLVSHVIVVGVDAASPAGIDGSIHPGRIVYQVNGQQVCTLAQVCHAMLSTSDWITLHTDVGMIIFSKEEVTKYECADPYPKPDQLCAWPCPTMEPEPLPCGVDQESTDCNQALSDEEMSREEESIDCDQVCQRKRLESRRTKLLKLRVKAVKPDTKQAKLKKTKAESSKAKALAGVAKVKKMRAMLGRLKQKKVKSKRKKTNLLVHPGAN